MSKPRGAGFLSSLSLPEVALDVTGLAGIVAAFYAGSYAYYLTNKMTQAEEKAKKQAARKAPPAKKAPPAAKKAPPAAKKAPPAEEKAPPAEPEAKAPEA